MDNHEEISNNKQIIEETLMQFGIQGKIINHHRGPVVTIYEFQPEVGIKQSKLIGLVEDLALALKVESVFVNPVKGERALGIQIPNKEPHIVFLGDLIQSAKYKSAQDSLTLTLGIADSGEIICENLATMPHLLIAGATGTGKSININAIICSLIIKLTPEKLRLIMIDPKVLELSIYNGIPHLLLPVITEARKANHALRWAIHEMEKRYEIMQSFNVRSIESYNQILQQDTNKSQTDKEAPEFEPFPYIAIIIDELADLMLTSPKETEILIQRLAQKARASGIHMILATQRPSVDVITGVIKANLPCRISFQVTSRHDSRTILDQIGAEKLLGKGDMFFLKPGQQRLKRIQGPYITDGEIADLVDLLKSKDQDYDQEVINWIEKEIDNKDEQQIGSSNIQIIDDTKYKEALEVAEKHGIVSASFLQRHLQIGYNRAARMIDYMEKEKIISKANGSKPRKWLGQKIES
jgi:S-DNA-T family DNA segregation ATPase FtsK/SpoIIIE